MDSFISWAGGKKALRGKVIKEFPEKGTFGSYVEPDRSAGINGYSKGSTILYID